MIINGKEHNFAPMSISALLQKLALDAPLLVVEVNGEIVRKHLFEERMLKKDDKIEIISFVGGG